MFAANHASARRKSFGLLHWLSISIATKNTNSWPFSDFAVSCQALECARRNSEGAFSLCVLVSQVLISDTRTQTS